MKRADKIADEIKAMGIEAARTQASPFTSRIVKSTEPFVCDECGKTHHPWRRKQMVDGKVVEMAPQVEYFLNSDGTKECVYCADPDDPTDDIDEEYGDDDR